MYGCTVAVTIHVTKFEGSNHYGQNIYYRDFPGFSDIFDVVTDLFKKDFRYGMIA